MSDDNVQNMKILLFGAGIGLIGILVSRIVAMIYRVFIARFYGPEAYGFFSISVAITTIIGSIALIGLPTGITRYVSYLSADKKPEKISSVLTSSLLLATAVSVVLSLPFMIFHEQISARFFKDSTGLLGDTLFWMTLSIPFFTIVQICGAALVGIKRIVARTSIEVIGLNVLRLGISVIFFLLGMSIAGIGIAWTLSAIVISFFALYFAYQGILTSKSVQDPGLFYEVVKFSFPLFLVTIMGSIITYTDTVMIGLLTGSAAAGIYNTAVPLALFIQMPSTLTTAMLLTVISEKWAKGDKDSVVKIYNTVTRWTIHLTAPIAGVFLFFPKQILFAVFGTEFVAGSSALIVLSCGMFLGLIAAPAYQLLSTIKKTWTIFTIGMVGALANVVLNVIWIPKYGLIGAAGASFVSYILLHIGYTISVFRNFSILPLFAEYTKALLLAGVLGMTIKYFIAPSVGLQTIVIICGIYGAAYFFGSIIFRFWTSEDIDLFRQAKRKFLGVPKKDKANA